MLVKIILTLCLLYIIYRSTKYMIRHFILICLMLDLVSIFIILLSWYPYIPLIKNIDVLKEGGAVFNGNFDILLLTNLFIFFVFLFFFNRSIKQEKTSTDIVRAIAIENNKKN